MKTLVFVAVALAVGVLALLLARRWGILRLGGASVWPFYVKTPLTQPEQILYHRLVRALPGHLILAQVQVSRVLGVKKGASFHAWNNRINRLSYDFVVCAPDATVIAAIELDDSTHQQPARVEADNRKDKATADAGLALIRWHVRSMPDEQAIQQAIRQATTAQAVKRGADR